MGRRAADLTTPVPVLGIPALVGVRGWRTTAGDRTGGALLQTLGPPCSVSVQTSLGISRPPTQHSVQLTDTLSTPSDNITQTPNSYITKETEYREILLLTKSDKEKRAILKQKTGESKTKKEVTFKAPADEAPRNITSSQKNSSRTYCYAKAIKTNPHFAANVTSVKPKLKSVRYTNGSVVDSEAIGGISIDNGEGEPVKSSISRGRNQTRLQGDFLERAGKTLLLSTARSSGMPQQICSHCGGRQSVTTRAIASGEKSSTVDACLGKNGITSPLTAAHFHMAQLEKNLKLRLYETSESITDRKKTMDVADNPELLYRSEELKHRKMPHPACPVHSRSNLVPLLQTHAASDATSTQPSTILHAKSITVTTATIETRQDDSSTKSFAKPPQDRKIQRPTSLMLTPQMATATKSNNPHLHTYPKHLRIPKHNSTQHNVPQSVCVSVHATPENTLLPPPSLYTTAAGPGNISIISTQKRTMTLNTTLMATESVPAKVASAQHETQSSTCTARINTATNTTNSPQITLKSPTVSVAAHALDPNHKLDTSTQLASVIQPRSPLYKLTEKPSLDNDQKPTGNTSILDSDLSALDTTTHEPQLPLTTVVHQNTLLHDSDQIMHGAMKQAFVAAQNDSIKPKYSNSEPTLHVSLASRNTTHNATNPLDSKVRLLSAVSPNSTSICRSIQYKKIALRKSSVNLKKPPPTATASSSTLTENQRNICASGTISLQSAEATQHSSKLSCNSTYQPSHTQVRGGRIQTNNESGVHGAVLNQETNSTTTPATLSELLIVSKHQDRDNDASDPHTAIITNNEWKNDNKKFSGNHVNESIACEPKHQGNSNPSQVTRLENYSTLMKSNSSCLQGCMNTEPQWLSSCQTPTETEYEEHCATFPPAKTSQERDSNPEKSAVSLSVRNANIELKSNADKQTLAHNPTSFDITKTKSEPVKSSLKDTGTHVIPISESSIHQNSDSDSLLQHNAHTRPERSFTPPPPLNSYGDHCTHTGPEWDSILPSSTMHLAYLPCLHSCKGEAIVRPDSKSSAACPQWCPEDASLAHSHPADAALLLPPSPQCCKSATLQQRLETVEASLAANKDRITTLLNIIHDLETCRTPSSR